MKALCVAMIAIPLLVGACAPAKKAMKKDPPLSVAASAEPIQTVAPPPLTDVPVEAIEGKKASSNEFRKAAHRYSLVLTGADARELFMSLARENELNLSLSPDVSGSISLDLKNATASEIIEEACALIGCRVDFGERSVRVVPERKETRFFRVDYLITSRTGKGELTASTSTGGGGSSSSGGSSSGGGGESSSSNSIATEEKVDFFGTLAEEVSTLLSSAEVKPVVNRAAGTMTLTDFPANLDRVAAYLAVIEERSRTGVLIEAKILEVALNDDSRYGVDWTVAPGLGSLSLSGGLSGGNLAASSLAGTGEKTASFAIGVTGSKFSAFLDALAEQGQLNVLSTPKVATLNNQKAIIKIGRQDVFFRATVTPATDTSGPLVTYSPDTITEGIILSVTPQVGRDGKVMLSVHPSITERVGTAYAPDNNSAPIIDVRETNTIVSVADGETVFIGGLMQERTQEVVKSVPFLGDIPFLGALFRNTAQTKKKTELVILITPRVASPGSLSAVGKADLDAAKALERGNHAGPRPWLYGTRGETESRRPW